MLQYTIRAHTRAAIYHSSTHSCCNIPFEILSHPCATKDPVGTHLYYKNALQLLPTLDLIIKNTSGKHLASNFLCHTVWNENFTWNLILRFYSWWQNRKIKIRKVYANLVYIITRLRKNWASVKLKSQQLFVQIIQRRTVKFNYRKVFVLYGID